MGKRELGQIADKEEIARAQEFLDVAVRPQTTKTQGTKKRELTTVEVGGSGGSPPIGFDDILQKISDVGAFFTTPEGKRVLVEAGGGLALGLAAPEVGIPKLLSQLGVTLSVTARNLLSRMIGAAGGEAIGSVVSETFDPSESPAQSAAAAAALGATGEGVAAGVFKAGQKALAPFKSKLEPGATEAIESVTKRGGIVTPGTALDSRTIDLLENVAEASLFGGGRLQVTKGGARDIAQDIVEDFAGKFRGAGTKEDIGQVVQELIEEGSDAFRAAGRGLFRKVDEVASGLQVDMRATKELAQRVLDKSEGGLGSPGIRRITRTILQKDDSVPFEVAQELRSDLIAIARQGTELVPAKAQGAGKILSKSVDDQMVSAAKASNREEVIAAFREANAFWKQGKATFNSSFIKALARKSPEAVFDAGIKAGRPGTIRTLRETINSPDAWKNIQGQFIDDLLRKSADVSGVVNGGQALRALKRFGDDALRELFPEGETKRFAQVLKTLSLTESPASAEGTGRMLIQLTQGGALLNLVSGGPLRGTSTAIILGPPTLARIFTNPTMVKLLTVGLKAPAGSEAVIRASAQLGAALQKEGLLTKVESIGAATQEEIDRFLDSRVSPQ